MNTYGLHHVTAITANAKENLHFYTQILGLRLVKKTVNQDDVTAYHLFYADKLGSPGTDMTFFDWPMAGEDKSNVDHGTDTISGTLFRVGSQDSLKYWAQRFDERNVSHQPIEPYGLSHILRFTDPEGQQLALLDDHQAPFAGEVWDKSSVPAAHALRGLYAIRLIVPQIEAVDLILTRLLGWRQMAKFKDVYRSEIQVAVYGMDGGGPGKEVHIIKQDGDRSWNQAGTIHHAAFRVRDGQELAQWQNRLDDVGLANSGIVDRYYFRSLYFRISPGILFEFATDGPGFTSDEPLESLGERLSLPPFLESEREVIEHNLKPIAEE